jgi:DNA-directed RNA polymerase specialized sigma subunit
MNTGQPTMEKNNLVYEDFIGLIWSIINKQKVREFMDDDDLFQELSLVWLNCTKNFRLSKGMDFVSYFYTAAVNYILRLKKKRNNDIYLWSLDYNISLTPKFDVPVGNLYVDDQLNIEEAYVNEEIIYQFLSHQYGAIAKYLLQGKTISYAADALEIDQSTATRWMKKMIEDVRKTQFEKSVL